MIFFSKFTFLGVTTYGHVENLKKWFISKKKFHGRCPVKQITLFERKSQKNLIAKILFEKRMAAVFR
jgi:hypothetical protein